jgi:hypothetical protein
MGQTSAGVNANNRKEKRNTENKIDGRNPGCSGRQEWKKDSGWAEKNGDWKLEYISDTKKLKCSSLQ